MRMLILSGDESLAAEIVADVEAALALTAHGRKWRGHGMSGAQWIDYLRACEAPDLREAVLRCLEADPMMLEVLAVEIWAENPVTSAPS